MGAAEEDRAAATTGPPGVKAAGRSADAWATDQWSRPRQGVRTTAPDRNAARAPDLRDRSFTAPAESTSGRGRHHGEDLGRVVSVSFVIDRYSRAIVSGHATTVKTTPLVTPRCGWVCGDATVPPPPRTGWCITAMQARGM